MASQTSRRSLRTVRIVAEGYHDAAFLEHVRASIAHQKEAGFKVTVGNARGKGAAHVIEAAKRQMKQNGYDLVAAFFDTDTDWTEDMSRQVSEKLVLLPSRSCLEAMLLRVAGERVLIDDDLKARFAPLVGGNPGDKRNYAARFSLDVLNDARRREDTIDRLLKLFEEGNCPPRWPQ